MKTIIITCCLGAWEAEKPEGTVVYGTTETFRTQKNLDRVYYMDKLDPHKHAGWEPQKGLTAWGGPAYTLKKYPNIPNSITYPIDAILEEFRKVYFASSTAYILAHAISEKPDKIILHKIASMLLSREYYYQKDCLDFWCGVAIGRGIEVEGSTDSYLMKANPWCSSLYGYIVNNFEDTANMAILQAVSEAMTLPQTSYAVHPDDLPGAFTRALNGKHPYPERQITNRFVQPNPVRTMYTLDCGHSTRIITVDAPKSQPEMLGCPACYTLDNAKKQIEETGTLKTI